MKCYWDFSERERGEMTAEQVDSLLAAELMQAGVVRVEQPVMLPTDMPEIPGASMFGIRCGYSAVSGIGFRTAEDAAAALALMVPLDSSYIGGTSYVVESDKSDRLTIEKIVVHSKCDIANHKSVAEKMAANKKANEEILAAYRKATEAVDKVCQGVWNDWRSCQCELSNLRTIMKTLDEYVTIAGDKEKALACLSKAFPEPQITKAREWLDESYVPVEAA